VVTVLLEKKACSKVSVVKDEHQEGGIPLFLKGASAPLFLGSRMLEEEYENVESWL
jgi:hypothetical protein